MGFDMFIVIIIINTENLSILYNFKRSCTVLTNLQVLLSSSLGLSFYGGISSFRLSERRGLLLLEYL